MRFIFLFLIAFLSASFAYAGPGHMEGEEKQGRTLRRYHHTAEPLKEVGSVSTRAYHPKMVLDYLHHQLDETESTKTVLTKLIPALIAGGWAAYGNGALFDYSDDVRDFLNIETDSQAKKLIAAISVIAFPSEVLLFFNALPNRIRKNHSFKDVKKSDSRAYTAAKISIMALTGAAMVKAYFVYDQFYDENDLPFLWDDYPACAFYMLSSALKVYPVMREGLRTAWDWMMRGPGFREVKRQKLQTRLTQAYQRLNRLSPEGIMAFYKAFEAMNPPLDATATSDEKDAHNRKSILTLNALLHGLGEALPQADEARPRGYKVAQGVGALIGPLTSYFLYYSWFYAMTGYLAEFGINGNFPDWARYGGYPDFFNASDYMVNGSVVIDDPTPFAPHIADRHMDNPKTLAATIPLTIMTTGLVAYAGSRFAGDSYCRFTGKDPNMWRRQNLRAVVERRLPGVRFLLSALSLGWASFFKLPTGGLAGLQVLFTGPYKINWPEIQAYSAMSSLGYGAIDWMSTNDSMQRLLNGILWCVNKCGKYPSAMPHVREKLLQKVVTLEHAARHMKADEVAGLVADLDRLQAGAPTSPTAPSTPDRKRGAYSTDSPSSSISEGKAGSSDEERGESFGEEGEMAREHADLPLLSEEKLARIRALYARLKQHHRPARAAGRFEDVEAGRSAAASPGSTAATQSRLNPFVAGGSRRGPLSAPKEMELTAMDQREHAARSGEDMDQKERPGRAAYAPGTFYDVEAGLSASTAGMHTTHNPLARVTTSGGAASGGMMPAAIPSPGDPSASGVEQNGTRAADAPGMLQRFTASVRNWFFGEPAPEKLKPEILRLLRG